MTASDHSTSIDPTHQRLAGRVQIALALGVLVVAIILNRLLIAGGDDATPSPTAKQPAPVAVIAPGEVSERLVIDATGVVQVRSRVAIVPQVSGRVVRIADALAAGGRFAANETLFVIEPTDYELAVERTEAELRSAQAALALEQAEAAIARQEWRLVNGEEPIPELVAREPQLAQAEAAVASQRSRLSEARVALERTRYSLPFNGRITSSDIELGQTVGINTVYGGAYSEDVVEVAVSLTTEQAAQLAPLVGRAVEIQADPRAAGAVVAGTVVRVGAELDERTRLLDVVVKPEANHALLPGQFIDARLTGDLLHDVLWLPAEAVGRNQAIWVVDVDALQRRVVNVVARERNRVLVTRFDFAQGVVLTPPPEAQVGQSVRILPPPQPSADRLAAEGSSRG